jgi:hypothetical protein
MLQSGFGRLETKEVPSIVHEVLRSPETASGREEQEIGDEIGK